MDPSRFDVVIAVIGETPYAETAGDVAPPAPLAHSVRYAKPHPSMGALPVPVEIPTKGCP